MPTETKPTTPTKAATFTEDDVQRIVGKAIDDFAAKQTPTEPTGDGPTPDRVLGAGKSTSGITVRKASER